MRILLLPPSDYLGHPNPCRLHHIFESPELFGDEVYVIRFSLYDETRRKSNAKVMSIGDTKFGSLSTYYLMNSCVFAKSTMAIINKFDIDVILFANLYPPYIVSKIIPRELFSVVDLIDHYPAIAAKYAPEIIPKRLVNYLFERMMRSILNRCNATIACSYSLVDYARKNGGRNVHRIPNGVEDFFFWDYEKEAIDFRRKFGIRNSDIVLCFVGNIEYWLEMEELLIALYLAKKRTKKTIKLFLVGGRLRTNYVNRIESHVRTLDLGGNIIRVNFVSHNDVPKYIAASDICVIPKNVRDPASYYSSPVKLWEYLAQGKPVISTPIPEVIREANEYVSIASTHAEYLSCIMAFLEDPSHFVEKAEKGRNLARERTWAKIAKAYRSLILSLLGSR